MMKIVIRELAEAPAIPGVSAMLELRVGPQLAQLEIWGATTEEHGGMMLLALLLQSFLKATLRPLSPGSGDQFHALCELIREVTDEIAAANPMAVD